MCPLCDSNDMMIFMGILGKRAYFTCTACGGEFSRIATDVDRERVQGEQYDLYAEAQ